MSIYFGRNESKSGKKIHIIFPGCILRKHFYNSSINIGSIFFSSSSGMRQSHHLLGGYATGINFSFNSFLSSSRF